MPSTTVSPCCAETNATLEAVAQALFKSWFVDFDPVHARALGEEPAGLSPEVAALFPASFEESELGMIPKGWRVGELGQEVRISYGKNLPTTKLLDAGFPVYGGNGQIGFFDSYLYKDGGGISCVPWGCIWESKSVSARSIYNQ